jgi:hypothetical protein
MSENALFQETQVAGLPDPKAIRLVISGLSDETLWLLTISGGIAPNYQLMYSIGADAYLNAFNQRLSMFEIEGVYIPTACDTGAPRDEPAFMTLYKERNIVSTSETTRMTYNGITIIGYFVKLDLGEYSKQGIVGHTFSLKFLGKIDRLDDGDTGRISTEANTPGTAQVPQTAAVQIQNRASDVLFALNHFRSPLNAAARVPSAHSNALVSSRPAFSETLQQVSTLLQPPS